MQYLTRFGSLPLFAFALAAPIDAQPVKKEGEYRRADTDFYLRRSVVKADPSAVIVSEGDYEKKGDAYSVPVGDQAPGTIYVEATEDWLEPVTPPSMPPSLDIAPNVMQIREPQGDVTVELPSEPDRFVPVTDRMVLPDGSVLKTGANGSTAILFGGVDSARLTPGSWAEVQQTVMPNLRSAEVDLRSGAVFSKVGSRPGERQNFRVVTPLGSARARGTDFLTVLGAHHADVFVAEGTVEWDSPHGHRVGDAESNGKGALDVIEAGASSRSGRKSTSVTDELTMALNFVPTVNHKLEALRDQAGRGTKLTERETTYLQLMRRVPVLLKLTRVPSSTPPPGALPPMLLPMPTPSPASAPAIQPSLGPMPPPVAPAPGGGTSDSAPAPSSSTHAPRKRSRTRNNRSKPFLTNPDPSALAPTQPSDGRTL